MTFNLPVTIARPFNTYGPRQSARAVISTIISQVLAGRESIKLGDITPTRDFNFVEDTCLGIVSLAECKVAVGEVVNIGSNSEISVGDIFSLICRITDRDVKLEIDKQRIRPEKSEVFRLFCDNKKINMLTGYTPQTNLEEGLTKTIDWFSIPENLAKYKTGIYNL